MANIASILKPWRIFRHGFKIAYLLIEKLALSLARYPNLGVIRWG